MIIIILALVIGLIPGLIAANKGHNFLLWWFFGAALFIIALPCAIMLKPKELGDARATSGALRRCPFCAELIQPAAIVCKHCHRDLPAVIPAGLPALPGGAAIAPTPQGRREPRL